MTGEPAYEGRQRRCWAFAADHLIDPDRGGWWPELDAALRPAAQTWAGKPDVYHAFQATLTVTALPPLAAAVLRPVVVPGGLGAHKWRDRTLLASHEADDPATLPLLLDADGYVLETSRTSVVAEAADGTLHTPPADGRILPGVTVARLGATPRALTLDDLRAAAAIHVASALRGRQPARLA